MVTRIADGKVAPSRQSVYWALNKDDINEKRRLKWVLHPEEIKKASATYYEKNKDTILAKMRLKYASNPEYGILRSKRRHEQNKDSINKANRERYKSDTEYRNAIRSSQTAKNHGMTVEEYLEFYKQSDGICAVCEKRPSSRALHVDHNHETGQIRGLLCHHCNTALGLLKEDINTINKLVVYLESYSK